MVRVRINKVTVGGVTVSVWTGTDPAPGSPPGHHPNFKVDIGAPKDDDWVCVGGGGTGHMRWGNYITASFPSDDSYACSVRPVLDGVLF